MGRNWGEIPATAPYGAQAARLRKMLGNAGWSTRDAAAAAGVTPSTVSRWCRGTHTPPAYALWALCLALGYDPRWVLDGEAWEDAT